MSNYIECPNRGFCGHKTHRIGTKAYQECLKRAADLARSKQIRAEAAAAREVWLEEYPHMRSIEEVRDILMSGKCDSYESPDGFVTDDMRIDRRGIRTYAETGKTDGVIEESWEQRIKADIKSNLLEEVAEESNLLNGFTDDRIDDLVDSIYNKKKSSIVRAMFLE